MPGIVWRGFGRGLELFMGGFGLLNVLGELRYPGFDANLWWIDLRPMPTWGARAFLAFAALLLMAHAIRPRCGRRRRIVTASVILGLLAFALSNAIRFFVLMGRGGITAGCPVPFSLFVAAALAVILAALCRGPGCDAKRGRILAWATTGASATMCLIGFPLAQMVCFGMTDYRRPADAAVVFGARVYADGRPSLALADRVRTGCALYRDGLVQKLILSGGPGDGATHETEAMRRFALALGVPSRDIVIDAEGVNTEATARHTAGLCASLGARRVLAVSHFYHLPRIKLAYQRQGWEVYAVPARQTRVLARLPRYMAREIAALWLYYGRPLWSDR